MHAPRHWFHAFAAAASALLFSALAHAARPTEVSVEDVLVEESDGQAVFMVTLSGAPRRNRVVQVTLVTDDGSATAGADYVARSGTLMFDRTNWQTPQAIAVDLLDDTVPEATEQFSLRVTAVTNARVGDGTGVATVTDDDEAPPNQVPVCAIDAPVGDPTIEVGHAVAFAATVTDDDGDPVAIQWTFEGGTPPASGEEDPGAVVYDATGEFLATLEADDGNGGACIPQTRLVTVVDALPLVSINSTSASGLDPLGYSPVPERASVIGTGWNVLAVNDLGMHCVDLDGRIANILPPFQVMLGQVVRRGATPELNPDGVELWYSAASNPADPALTNGAPLNGLAPDGTLYKSNFWDMIDRGAWENFYPPVLPVPLADLVPQDRGLLVPNTEDLYIGPDGMVDAVAAVPDGELNVSQHAVPGVDDPLVVNDPQRVHERYGSKPFFLDFPFGYVAEDVDLYEAAGIPVAPFDDAGRQNPFPLFRIEARSGEDVLGTIDAVLPVSSETSCSNCHADVVDVPDRLSTAPIDALAAAGLPVANSAEDPALGAVPAAVSIEYAADLNILRLHDLKHGAAYVDTAHLPAACDIVASAPDGDANCLTQQALVQQQPVVCQSCHYTPALDLAQVGPLSGPPGSAANGRNQLPHETNSRVMHNHHGALAGLFPPIPTALQDPATGAITNQPQRTAALEANCYQCHPGKETQCLRGAMFNGGILCSDCHGSMAQVGDDFSAGVSPDNPGAFQLGAGNFYDPASEQRRVPWANEPGCGSCHTGDANTNLAGGPDVLVNLKDANGVVDGIRLRQAFRMGDAKATPIVPANKLFAEPAVAASFNGFANPGAGNPKLYRLSTGHGGVLCEGCHGATHAEWPVADPAANDNVMAIQLQGHAGPIGECATCHETGALPSNTLGGPHNMHLVNDRRFWKEGHKDIAKRENGRPGSGLCGSCHGADHLGTVLSRAPVERNFLVEEQVRTVAAGEPVACNLCHSLEKSFGR